LAGISGTCDFVKVQLAYPLAHFFLALTLATLSATFGVNQLAFAVRFMLRMIVINLFLEQILLH
jgi:hypothetical protein